ncbi:MAG TPA: VWA domain-containing protein [Pyrinomonadaceae bacterium]|jgi:VWFA-related protein
MPSEIIPLSRKLLSFLFCFNLLVPLIQAQQTPAPTTNAQQPFAVEQDDEVVRVDTELVQTDVMVFDKQGRFVEGLQPAQFELRVDGKPQAISFFEMIRAGSLDEDVQLAAARGLGGSREIRTSSKGERAAVRPLDRGRTIFFFIDDMHLSAGNLPQTRDAMRSFVNEMGQNDEAAILSTTGQIGFLQQLTGDKNVLRKAIDRLTIRQWSYADAERPPMSEYNALAIERRDIGVTEYFRDEWIKQNGFAGDAAAVAAMAEAAVRSRANNILQQSAHVTQKTLGSLENVVRSVAPLPGRKILFFISEGFFLNERSSSVLDQLRRVTDAAARTGTVIYSMDARGLTSGMTDAATEGGFDPTGSLARAGQGEFAAAQDGLNALAVNTGGRAILNKNRLDTEVKGALKETEVYYLLAWTPSAATGRGNKFRTIDVKVAGRPDLRVRVRRGYLVERDEAQKSSARNRTAPVSDKKASPVAQLFSALRSPYPRNDLQTALYAGYADAPNAGVMLTTLVQVDGASLDFGNDANKQNAKIELIGGVFDERGKAATTFQQELVVPPPLPNYNGRRHITYNHPHRLAPGLYQVRVAVRDGKSGRIGSATQWIQIPDIQQGQFSLSSIFLSERPADDAAVSNTAQPATGTPLETNLPSVDRRFARMSKLQFIVGIYNAARQPTPPDVALQIQVFRDDQPVITTPLRKVDTSGVTDLSRIPYAAEFGLGGLPAGQYVLQITAIDRIAKSNATQRVNFTIE